MIRQDSKLVVYKLIDDFEKNERQCMSKNFQGTEARDRFGEDYAKVV
jgi:hypothetical protein